MSDGDPLADALVRLAPPLHTVARDVLAAEGRLDAVACDPDGAAVAVLRAPADADRSALVDLLAHVGWLAPRLADWRRLAPDLPLRPEASVRGLLLAPSLDPRTRAAAAALGPARLALGLWHAPPPGVPGTPWIEPVDASRAGGTPAGGGADPIASWSARAPETAAPAPSPRESLRSRFRTGLHEADLAAPPACDLGPSGGHPSGPHGAGGTG